MNIAVCVKQIPDPAAPGRLAPESFNLIREGKLVMDDSDAYGVEMALQLVDAAGGGDVTLVSMAPNGETSGLRTALAMGAARAVLVSDERLAGSDALSTAKVLAAAIRRNPFDLVITATESTDGYTGTVPVQIAEILGVAAVSFVKKVTLTGTRALIERQTESGYDEIVSELPLVISVTAGVVEPRYPSFKGIMAAKSKPIESLSLDDLGLDDSNVGGSGAREMVVALRQAEARQSGQVIEDDGEAYAKIVEYLKELKVV